MAIEAKDLRIGNLIASNHFPDKEVVMTILELRATQAIVLSGNGTTSPMLYDNELSGIPLTPEWLERLGFTVEYTVGGWLRWQKGDFKLLDRKLPHDGPKDPVLFVHQLQNLYYAITGSELMI